MRKDIHNKIEKYTREELSLLNKSELARRFNCDPRTINRYLKVSSGELVPKKSSRAYKSLLDDYKSITKEKVDIHGLLWQHINLSKRKAIKANIVQLLHLLIIINKLK